MINIRLWTRRFVISISNYHRWVVLIAFILLVGLEYSEFQFKISDFFHLGEVAVYAVLLTIMGVLIELVLNSYRSQQATLKLLKYKHEISLDIIPYQDWDSLVSLLAKSLAQIVGVHQAYLYILEPFLDRLERVGEWVDCDEVKDSIAEIDCQQCIDNAISNNLGEHYCKYPVNEALTIQPSVYCHPIYYKNNLHASIKFILEPGQTITAEQRQILKSVNDEVVIALIAGRDRKRLSELELIEATLAERHSVSQYLHDNLSQNIGYLRMKLDQISHQPELFTTSEIRSEVSRMKEVANDSYNIVRSKLETIHSDTLPILTNLLKEHALKKAQRAKFELGFSSTGAHKLISIEVQRAVFYVFQEMLSNIEKHANAKKVDVTLDWRGENLTVTVSDDGVGFDPQSERSNKHLGLEIVKERMDGIHGRMEIASSRQSGTTVKIIVPYSARSMEVVYE